MRTVDENTGEGFTRKPITKTSFLSSLIKWYPNGIHVEVDNVSRIFPNKLNKMKPSVFITLNIVGEMKRCLCYEIGEDGEYILEEDDFGKLNKVPSEMDGTFENVSISFNLKEDQHHEGEYYVHPNSTLYPLIRFFFNDELKPGYKKGLVIDEDDLKGLEGIQFLATAKKVKATKDFQAYNVLVPKPLYDVEDVDGDSNV